MKVVHIGFPKTATTFLQKVVFPALPTDFAYFDKERSAPFFAPLMNYDDSIFDQGGQKREIERAWSVQRHCLFSYEPLTGAHYRCAFFNRTPIAKRLKALGFDRAIITIRNQFDALESAYKQYVKSGGVLRFDEYVTFDSDRPKYLYPEYFDYHAIYRLYAETFGEPNLLILQYENLRDRSFVGTLCDFLQVAPFEIALERLVNTSLSCEKTRILRIINHLTYNSFRPSHLISKRISSSFFHRRLAALPFPNGRKSFLTVDKRNAIASFYGESNRRLRKEAGIALAPEYP